MAPTDTRRNLLANLISRVKFLVLLVLFTNSNSFGQVIASDSLALVALYNSTDGANWTNNTNWLTGSVGDWNGVAVLNNRVTSLQLGFNNLNGTIPVDIGDLDGILTLNLSVNQLTGTLPTEIGNLSLITRLQINQNQLSGSLPTSLGNLTALTTLAFSLNQFSGPLPPELGNLVNLTSFFFDRNPFTGSIPPEFGNLINVVQFDVNGTRLTGAIPVELGNLASCTFMTLGDSLTGPLPSELGNLINLTILRIEGPFISGSIPSTFGNLTNLDELTITSPLMSGSIPLELGNLNTLQTLFISGTQISGSLPIELGNMTAVTQLIVIGNQITGSIPSTLNNLTGLITLNLADNQLSGSIPPEFGSFATIRSILLENNQLSGTIPIELGNMTIDNLSTSTLNFSNNQLTGEVPGELGNLDNLDYLYVSGNQLTSISAGIGNGTELKEIKIDGNLLESLPDFSSFANSAGLSIIDVANNQLDFGDLEPHANNIALRYNPQDSVGTAIDTLVMKDDSITLSVQTGGSSNTYRWVKDFQTIFEATDSILILDPVELADSGTYVLEIRNSIVNNLVLYSKPINVVVEGPPVSSDAFMIFFDVPTRTDTVMINFDFPNDMFTVDLTVENGTDLTDIVATFIISDSAIATVNGVIQESEVTSNNFTSPVTYVVTAEDGVTSINWIVTITKDPSTAANIQDFSILDQIGATTINTDLKTITLDFIADADFTGMVAGFALSPGATAKVGSLDQVSGTTPNDFSSPVTYTVTAEDGTTTADWTVTVNPVGVTSITNDRLSGKVKLFPNPTHDNLNVVLGKDFGSHAESFLIDLSGKIIMQKSIRANGVLDLSTVKRGVYILIIKSDKHLYRAKIEKH